MADSTSPKLAKDVFGVDVPNHELLKVAYDMYLANSRQASATTLRRGEVRGGGKKPWKQKGTGRARFGSSRNPLWRSGGVVFGPLGNENYSKRLSTSSKRVALRQALTLASQAGKITIDEIKVTGKTKEVVKYLSDNKFDKKRRVLVVVDKKTDEMMNSSNNVQSVMVVSATYLSVFHILNADVIVMSKPALSAVESWLGKAPATAKKEVTA